MVQTRLELVNRVEVFSAKASYDKIIMFSRGAG